VGLHYDFGLLRDSDYRKLFASTTVSQFGFHIMLLALSLVAIVSLAASPLEVGLLSALQTATSGGLPGRRSEVG
jgi:multisubunit Na+/H+ antiporter MnhG subunit